MEADSVDCQVTSGNEANSANRLAGLAAVAATRAEGRGSDGRFLTGNSGGGRPRGARNKLTESVLAIVALDFEQNGVMLLAKMREEDPATYLRFVSSLLPKDLIAEHEKSPIPYSGSVTLEELAELVDAARRRHFAELAIRSVNGP